MLRLQSRGRRSRKRDAKTLVVLQREFGVNVDPATLNDGYDSAHLSHKVVGLSGTERHDRIVNSRVCCIVIAHLDLRNTADMSLLHMVLPDVFAGYDDVFYRCHRIR